MIGGAPMHAPLRLGGPAEGSALGQPALGGPAVGGPSLGGRSLSASAALGMGLGDVMQDIEASRRQGGPHLTRQLGSLAAAGATPTRPGPPYGPAEPYKENVRFNPLGRSHAEKPAPRSRGADSVEPGLPFRHVPTIPGYAYARRSQPPAALKRRPM